MCDVVVFLGRVERLHALPPLVGEPRVLGSERGDLGRPFLLESTPGGAFSGSTTSRDQHFHATGHQIIQSFEPGENRRWCYIDVALSLEEPTHATGRRGQFSCCTELRVEVWP